jgi:hypothetical protein
MIEVNLRGEGALDDFIRILSKFGGNLRSLKLNDCTLDNLSFTRIFENLPKLEHLTLKSINFIQSSYSCSPIHLQSLKRLRLEVSSWKILDFIDAKLEVLEVIGFSSNTLGPLTNFMKKQNKLKVLELGKQSYEELFKAPPVKFPFELKELKLSTCFDSFEFLHPQLPVNFHAFIQDHCQQIEVFNSMNLLQPMILQTVFKTFTSLKELEINVSTLPNDDEFYRSFKHMKFLKALILHGEFGSSVAAEVLLTNCTEIETLEVISDESILITLLPLVSICNAKLQRLSMFTFKSFCSDTVFEALKALEIVWIQPEDCEALRTFIDRNKIHDFNLRYVVNLNANQKELMKDKIKTFRL